MNTHNETLLNSPLSRKYSILGGVVAPKRSAYTFNSMANPLAEQPTKHIDTSLPSLRYNSAVSKFNDFNPYNRSARRSKEVIKNAMEYRQKNSTMIYKVNVNTFQPTGNPVLAPKFVG